MKSSACSNYALALSNSLGPSPLSRRILLYRASRQAIRRSFGLVRTLLDTKLLVSWWLLCEYYPNITEPPGLRVSTHGQMEAEMPPAPIPPSALASDAVGHSTLDPSPRFPQTDLAPL